jgi:hypothetical protein
MTSTGFRLAILIFTTVSILQPVGARAGAVFSSGHPSARIYALGRDFAGIIPDGLTDLALNPAHAYYTGSLTINYGVRGSSGQYLPFPIVGQEFVPYYTTVSSIGTNELRVYGMNALGLKWAIDTEWSLHHSDNCNQKGTNPINRNYNGGVHIELREDCAINDNNYFRLDIAGAGKIGDKMVLGVRAGGTFSYSDSKRRYRRDLEEYSFDSDTGEYEIYVNRSSDELNGTAKKLFTGYLEAGLAWEDAGEIAVRGGYAEGNALTDNYQLSIESRYDDYTHEIDSYSYRLWEFSEDRMGDSWLLSGFVKKRYSGGFVILAGGSFEKGSYECDWRNGYTQYSWGDYDDTQILDRSIYPGEGTRSMSEAVFRIGKTYALESRIDLTPGAHINYWREKFDESGDAGFETYMLEDGTTASYGTRFPLAFARTSSQTGLVLPIAIEFRPASFFHFYSGFGATFTWTRSVRKNTFLMEYGQANDTLAPQEVETENNGFDSSYYASLGLSLRYREKLFFDMYTGSDIVPQRITGYFFDLRYVF